MKPSKLRRIIREELARLRDDDDDCDDDCDDDFGYYAPSPPPPARPFAILRAFYPEKPYEGATYWNARGITATLSCEHLLDELPRAVNALYNAMSPLSDPQRCEWTCRVHDPEEDRRWRRKMEAEATRG